MTGFTRENRPLAVTIRFSVNDTAFGRKGPWIDKELIGVFSTVGQTIEDRRGDPIKVDTDFNGRDYSRPMPGPLADLKRGVNTIVWKFEKYR